MRYTLNDDDARPDRLFLPPRYEHTLVDVAGGDHDPAAGVLRDFFEGISPTQVTSLRDLTARGAGFGHDLASSMYADDLDPDDGPFEGVMIRSQFRDDEVVLSSQAYEQLIAALVSRSTADTRSEDGAS